MKIAAKMKYNTGIPSRPVKNCYCFRMVNSFKLNNYLCGHRCFDLRLAHVDLGFTLTRSFLLFECVFKS